jgi:exosome complex component RRP42
MAPAQNGQVLLSPAELSFLYQSLSLSPPVRPDGRAANQFRPLIAESGFLPTANGSARICFADGAEAIAGVKAEVAKTVQPVASQEAQEAEGEDHDGNSAEQGQSSWVEISIEMPGFRDDDSHPIFLASMLTEALLASEGLMSRLRINQKFHWQLYVDVCNQKTDMALCNLPN